MQEAKVKFPFFLSIILILGLFQLPELQMCNKIPLYVAIRFVSILTEFCKTFAP